MKIAPARPPGLTARQWKTLARGLAWERGDRPASVREWLADLDLGRAPLGPIPQPENSKVSLLARGGVTSALIALLAVLVVGGTTWALLSRPKPPPLVADSAAAEATVDPPVIPDTTIGDSDNDDAAAPVAQVPAAKIDPKTHTSASRPVDKTERIGMVATSYAFRGGQKFAEIRVHRSSGSKGATSFEWWTEAASALAGTDFAPQAPARVFFPVGVHTVSLFIKLLPNTARKRTALFYVVLGNTSSGSALSSASKASISLHP